MSHLYSFEKCFMYISKWPACCQQKDKKNLLTSSATFIVSFYNIFGRTNESVYLCLMATIVYSNIFKISILNLPKWCTAIILLKVKGHVQGQFHTFEVWRNKELFRKSLNECDLWRSDCCFQGSGNGSCQLDLMGTVLIRVTKILSQYPVCRTYYLPLTYHAVSVI